MPHIHALRVLYIARVRFALLNADIKQVMFQTGWEEINGIVPIHTPQRLISVKSVVKPIHKRVHVPKLPDMSYPVYGIRIQQLQ